MFFTIYNTCHYDWFKHIYNFLKQHSNNKKENYTSITLPIQNIISMLRKDLETTAKVTVLTARLMAYPVRRYLKTEHNLEAYVVAVGS